ncbi:MAG: hypothetical protein KKC03_13600, partial [Bacteroidetes bacterium]|nr:hypothetical protein [Bacteroidota bacterium]
MEIGVKACRKVPGKKNVYSTGDIGGSLYTEFKVGETYELKESPMLCERGFHYFRKEDLCFGIDLFVTETVFLEVEILGEVVQDTYKRATNKLKILRYIPIKEWKKLFKSNQNSGYRNSGYKNSGDWNSGNQNSGYQNSGNQNSGYKNSGDWNSGYKNSGNQNSGYKNSGDWNSGYKNSGDKNSGNQNSGDQNSGNKNSGDQNSGNKNSGNQNSGDWNSGNQNSGDQNSG